MAILRTGIFANLVTNLVLLLTIIFVYIFNRKSKNDFIKAQVLETTVVKQYRVKLKSEKRQIKAENEEKERILCMNKSI